MKRLLISVSIAMTLLIGMPVFAHDRDIRIFPECKYCGMYRKLFAHSRMVVRHKDGTLVGVCSVNCAAIDYVKAINDSPDSLRVGDYKTRKLIDAEKAYWVIGGSKQGVMTERAKWAFRGKRDAQDFIKKYGGRLTTFDEVMKATYEDMYEDMRALEQLKLEHARSRQTHSQQSHGVN